MSTTKVSKGLGRGFDTLIPKDFDNGLLLDEKERIQKVSLENIHPNEEQPRKQFDEESLQELAVSIKRYGILQPIIVTPSGDNKYRIIAGERRWRAAQIANLTALPVVVRTSQELEQLEIALIENVQRVDLTPLEQAATIQRLHDQFNFSYEDISRRLGKAVPTLNNIVRLLQLPEPARKALEDNLISEGHARAILALKGEDQKQQELLDLIQKQHWSVRQAEQFVTAFKKGTKSTAAVKQKIKTENPATRNLSKLIAAPVSIRRTAKGGKLEIGFNSDQDLEQLIGRLVSLLQQR